MGTGYTRNDTPNNIADGNVINASDLDGEFDAIQTAFNGSTGHSHDGTTGEGPQIATAGLADNAVTTAKITDANVTLAKMAANSVDSDQYVDGSIDTAHIGNLQVTTAKIAADAIDGTKLADNAVDSEHYTDGSIDRVHLAADIVDGTKIADDSIDSEHYVDGSIDTAHIADDAVTSAKLDTNIQIAGTLGVTGVSSFADGSNSAPSISFTSDTNTGIYRGGTDILKFVTAGTDAITIDASQNVDVNGTVTADGLTVDTDAYRRLLLTYPDAFTSKLQVGFSNFYVQGSATTDRLTIANNSGGQTHFENQSKTSMVIDNSGDISFYEDTGTTPKLFWDASEERLGIGNASPSSPLHISLPSSGTDVEGWRVSSGGGGLLYVRVDDASSANPTWEMNVASSEQLAFGIGASEAMRIDDSRNVGIGTGSPATNLHIAGSGTGLPATSGTTQTYGRIRTSGSGSNAVLDIGNAGATGAWLQVTNQTSLGVEYPLLLNPNGGNVGIGTSSPNEKLTISSGAISFLGDISTPAIGAGLFRPANNTLAVVTGSTERMRIDSSGNVGIGITPSFNLHVFQSGPLNSVLESDTGNSNLRITSGDGDSAQIFFGDQTNDTISQIKHDNSDNSLAFFTAGSNERMRIDNSGNVGIGTDNPPYDLVISNNGAEGLEISPNAVAGGSIFQSYNRSGAAYTPTTHIASDFRFNNGGTEAMRIDSSGNLLVATTSTSIGDDGFRYNGSSGWLGVTRNAGQCLYLNRRTTDGSALDIRKDNSTAGSIGAKGGDIYIATSDTGIRMYDQSDAIIPVGTDGASRDNAIDLGISSVRFDDIYATNGTIQTSDRNEKNTITDSDLGIDFIKRLSPKSYIFNGKTRTHYGLIAQDIETVLTDIGKTGSDFAGFIKSDISEEQDGSSYRYGLRYTEFVAPLIQAVKDQQATIDALTARITALENGE